MDARVLAAVFAAACAADRAAGGEGFVMDRQGRVHTPRGGYAFRVGCYGSPFSAALGLHYESLLLAYWRDDLGDHYDVVGYTESMAGARLGALLNREGHFYDFGADAVVPVGRHRDQEEAA